MGRLIRKAFWAIVWYYRRKKYHKYLKSKRWHKKRLRTLERDDYTCQKCGAHSALEVHHLTYAHIFHEKDGDLLTLCHQCHREEHL